MQFNRKLQYLKTNHQTTKVMKSKINKNSQTMTWKVFFFPCNWTVNTTLYHFARQEQEFTSSVQKLMDY